MNTNRMLGIFIAVTLLAWILIFALSPQPKYQQTSNINVPKLPEPLVEQDNLQKIEFKEVNNDSLEIDTKDTLHLQRIDWKILILIYMFIKLALLDLQPLFLIWSKHLMTQAFQRLLSKINQIKSLPMF